MVSGRFIDTASQFTKTLQLNCFQKHLKTQAF